jgi:SAM-dependent methyltransferase
VRNLIRALLPIRVRGVPGRVRWLSTRPLSDSWGFDRGTPIDRHFIEAFLARHAGDIRGRVLEIKSDAYTVRFGRNVESRDVLDIDASNPNATLVADLTNTADLPASQYDCFILTQTLQFIFDFNAAIASAHRLLRPGGTLLVTVPCVSRVVPRYGQETDYWRFTPASCRRLFGDVFGGEHVTVEPLGNVGAGVAFLRGVAVEEVPMSVLEVNDENFPVVVAVRAIRR